MDDRSKDLSGNISEIQPSEARYRFVSPTFPRSMRIDPAHVHPVRVPLFQRISVSLARAVLSRSPYYSVQPSPFGATFDAASVPTVTILTSDRIACELSFPATI